MRIAIFDDCLEDALSLKGFLGGNEVRIYQDVDVFLIDLEEKGIQYDLYLLDIYLEEAEGMADLEDFGVYYGNGRDGVNGIRLAERICRKQEGAAICFISSSNNFYREAYELLAVQYLLKPVQEEDLTQLVDKVSQKLAREREQKLSITSHGHSEEIPYGKILYIAGRGHMLSVHCTDRSSRECEAKLDELALEVCGDVFMRCHQNFIVNMYHVDNISKGRLMVSENRIPLSRKYDAEVRRQYREILFEEVD